MTIQSLLNSKIFGISRCKSLAYAATASAVLSAAPSYSASVTIGSNDSYNCIPFGCPTLAGTYQQAYSSNVFSVGPFTITSFDLFEAIQGVVSSATFDVYFSTSTNPVGSLSTTFASNIGVDNTLFGTFSVGGPIPPVQSFVGASPFAYNPSSGDLLMTVYLKAVSSGLGVAYHEAGYSAAVERVYGGSSVGTKTFQYGLQTRFNYTYDLGPAQSVPGPLPLFGAAAAFGYSRKLRNRIKDSKLPVATAIN
jgi:hypothetical protein